MNLQYSTQFYKFYWHHSYHLSNLKNNPIKLIEKLFSKKLSDWLKSINQKTIRLTGKIIKPKRLSDWQENPSDKKTIRLTEKLSDKTIRLTEKTIKLTEKIIKPKKLSDWLKSYQTKLSDWLEKLSNQKDYQIDWKNYQIDKKIHQTKKAIRLTKKVIKLTRLLDWQETYQTKNYQIDWTKNSLSILIFRLSTKQKTNLSEKRMGHLNSNQKIIKPSLLHSSKFHF